MDSLFKQVVTAKAQLVTPRGQLVRLVPLFARQLVQADFAQEVKQPLAEGHLVNQFQFVVAKHQSIHTK